LDLTIIKKIRRYTKSLEEMRGSVKVAAFGALIVTSVEGVEVEVRELGLCA
jgi:hypothetical protein